VNQGKGGEAESRSPAQKSSRERRRKFWEEDEKKLRLRKQHQGRKGLQYYEGGRGEHGRRGKKYILNQGKGGHKLVHVIGQEREGKLIAIAEGEV